VTVQTPLAVIPLRSVFAHLPHAATAMELPCGVIEVEVLENSRLVGDPSANVDIRLSLCLVGDVVKVRAGDAG
jgi:hypothetical protein